MTQQTAVVSEMRFGQAINQALIDEMQPDPQRRHRAGAALREIPALHFTIAHLVYGAGLGWLVARR